MRATKTKIVATIGPASRRREVLEAMVERGVDVVRFNLSHGEHAEHQKALETVRAVADERNLHVAVMADLCGPKVRTGEIDPHRAELKAGAKCSIVSDEIEGTAERFSTNYPGLVAEVEAGHRVLIDDGQIRLEVEKKEAETLICQCEVGGVIGSHKGINVPDSNLSLPALSEKDEADLEWAIRNRFDFVALSFVRRAGDLELLRETMRRNGGDAPIVSKIETPQAIKVLDEVVAGSDAVLVARGDLGVEMDVWRIPMLQKRIVQVCRRAGKPVIIATQMLHSMIDHPAPTRAEVTDVANSVLDGTDAVMLSAETAVGSYPVEAVAMLARITGEAESQRGEVFGGGPQDFLHERLRVGYESDRTTAAVARSAALVAHDTGAKLIAVWCQSGRTAQWISKYQLPQRLIGLSAREEVCRRLVMSYGIEPMLVPGEQAAGSAPWSEVQERIVKRFGLGAGDFFIVVGDPSAKKRRSTLVIHAVE